MKHSSQRAAFSSIRKVAVALLAVSILIPEANGVYGVSAAPSSDMPAIQTFKPDWEKTVRKVEYGVGDEISTYANGRVFYKLGRTLTATDVKSGKFLWSYAAEPGTAPVASASGVCFVDTQGYAHKVDPVTGKRVWKSAHSLRSGTNAYAAYNAAVQGSLLLVGDSRHLSAFDLKTGKLTWQTPAAKTYGYRVEKSEADIVLATSVKFDPGIRDSSRSLYAFDAKTGKRIWGSPSVYSYLLTVQEGYAYVKMNPTEKDQYKVNIQKIDLKSSKVLETFRYIPYERKYMDNGNPVSYFETQNSVIYDDGQLYVHYTIDYDRRLWGLARIPLDTPSGTKPASTLSFSSPIYQVALSKHHIAVALMGKEVDFLDRKTNKTVGKSYFLSGFFNQTLDADSHFLVQTAGKIFAFQMPAPL